MNVRPAGSRSTTTTPVAGEGPALRTRMVKLTPSLARNPRPLTIFCTEMSATGVAAPGLTVALLLLLAVFRSS